MLVVEVILTTFLPEYIKYIKLYKMPFLLFCVHPFTDDTCKLISKKILGIVCGIIKLDDKAFG